MAFEPVRIIHASHLRLDHQLEGLTHLPNDLHRVVEDATLSAFDFLLAACIDHQVDFLLLTGNTFDWHDGSLRAWSALEQGFDLLGEHGVHVFIVPGETDPASAWLNGPHWPDNVTILYAEDGEPVAAMRDDKAVATVRLLDAEGQERDGLKLPRTASGSGPLRLAPFTIGVMPIDSTHLQDRLATQEKSSARLNDTETVAEAGDAADEFGDGIIDHYADDDEAISEADDAMLPPDPRDVDVIDYIALGGPPRRQTFVTDEGLAHHPGPTQGMHSAEVGHCGVTLVELDRQGKGRSTFIPTGVVRWERAEPALSVDASIEDLQNAVRERVQNIAATSTEKVCIVRWSVPGNGRLERQLGGHERLHETIERAAAEACRHAWRMVHHVEWTWTDRIRTDKHTSSTHHLQEYLDGIAEIAASSTAESMASVKRLERQLGHHLATKILIQQRLDTAHIQRQARRLGYTWFQDMRGENDAA